ncbi:MAG: hypothetical protein CR986_02410 [Ignavibacteriae bacterium]|nr:MAG: hypothetical protein CR986_02410 [Ignavibacteriota bacterium]
MELLKKFASSIILLPICIWLVLNYGDFIFLLDHFNLLIHEGGHGIFRFFGKFIYTLGGTLMQIIIPSIFIYYFYSNKKNFGVQISLVYLGENLFNISKYAADAVAQKLPLLGGKKVYHDWHWLLSRMGILEYDQLVGLFFVILAIISFMIALLYPLKPLPKKRVNLDLDL